MRLSVQRVSSIVRRGKGLPIAAALGLALAHAPSDAGAQANFPSQNVNLIVSTTAGSNPDVIARIFQPHLTNLLKQSVTVENKAGATGQIAANLVSQAPPDGHTLLITTGTTIASVPALYPTSGRKAIDGLAPVSKLINVGFMIAIRSDLGIKTFPEFLQRAKEKPGSLNIATAGKGSGPFMVAELLKKAANVDLTVIPHRGGGDAVTTLLSKNADILIDTLTLTSPLTDAGKLISIAYTGAERSTFLPDIPTVKEFGVPGCEVSGSVVLMAPKGTPEPIIDKLYRAFQEVGKLPDVQKKLAVALVERVTNSPSDLMREWKEELAVWEGLVKDRNLRME
jgi:tripartite-type tricarboxylate transporter receptor subunit TctC